MERRKKTASEFLEGILRGDRVLLGQAITLVESQRPDDQQLAQEVIEQCLPHTGRSLRLGITGPPGAGKSSFIETFGIFLIEGHGRKVAVLAIDPTSQLTRGSILGDKTRMEKLSVHAQAFIRPSAAGSSLGGVAARTREAALLCEAAGFDTILIETVGVGQSETMVHGMVDFLLLLLLPGAGDELQGIKRGIVEMADLVAVNKSDGDLAALAGEAKRDFGRALHLFPAKPNGWAPTALTCSALTGDGMADIWAQVLNFQQLVSESDWLETNRREQSRNWFREMLDQGIRQFFFQNPKLRAQVQLLEERVVAGETLATKAVGELLGGLSTNG